VIKFQSVLKGGRGLLKYGERLEPLGKGVSLIVNSAYHFSTDTILLAQFSEAEKSKNAVDLGSGCGAVSFFWSREDKPERITAVEIQCDAADMIRRSAEYNKLEDRIAVIKSDMRSLKGQLPYGTFDLAACNPPYKAIGHGIQNPDTKKLAARHETDCTLNEAVFSASKLLQFGGRLCLCHRPERLTDILLAMRQNDLEPKKIRFVQHRKSKAPKLVLIEGRKGGKHGFLSHLPVLVIEDGQGGFSKEMLDIYGEYKN